MNRVQSGFRSEALYVGFCYHQYYLTFCLLSTYHTIYNVSVLNIRVVEVSVV
jgi:hypothetical protein